MSDEVKDQTATPEVSTSVDLKTGVVSAFTAWLFRQNAQTVLLFVIVLGGGYSALFQFPWMLDSLVTRLEKTFIVGTTAYEKDQERDQDRYEAQQRFLEELMRNQRGFGMQRPVVKNNPQAADAPL